METDSFIRDICSALNDPEGKRLYVKALRQLGVVLRDLNFTVPRIKSDSGVIGQALQLDMPYCCYDVIKAGRWVKVGNNDFVYPLGKRKGYEDIPEAAISSHHGGVGCSEIPETVEAENFIPYYNFQGYGVANFGYIGHYYGEYYAFRQSRFYSYFVYNENLNRIEIVDNGFIKPGHVVVYSYLSAEDDYLIPIEMEMVVRYRVMELMAEGENPRKASYYFNQYRRHLRQYNDRKDTYSYQDYLDALTSEYSTVAR